MVEVCISERNKPKKKSFPSLSFLKIWEQLQNDTVAIVLPHFSEITFFHFHSMKNKHLIKKEK